MHNCTVYTCRNIEDDNATCKCEVSNRHNLLLLLYGRMADEKKTIINYNVQRKLSTVKSSNYKVKYYYTQK